MALYAADLLEVEAPNPLLAAICWTLRGELLHAGWKIDSSGTPLVGTELRRSFDQFCCSLADVDRRPDIRENRCPVVPRWSRGSSLDSGGPTRYSDACDLLDSIVTRDRATRPDIRIDMSEQIGATWATSRFLTLCHDEPTCRDAFGPFAEFIHAEVSAFVGVPFAMDSVLRPLLVGDSGLGPIGFADALAHEVMHIKRRNGQMLQTDDDRWLLVRQDVPIASAETYRAVLADGDVEVRIELHGLVRAGQNGQRRGRTGATAPSETCSGISRT